MTPTAIAMRVLIVEDECELGEVFHDFVAARGHQADVVGSAEAALDRLQASRPHAIILDVKLPGMSGLEFMRLPAVREAGIPVIVVSGHATEPEARECLRLGALEFLAKPVALEVLGRVLDHAELFAASPEVRRHERRATGRVAVNLPVRVTTERGKVATGRVLEVSGTGLRARLDAGLRPGAAVRVAVTMPDGHGPLDVIAVVVRSDLDGAAVWFLDVAPADVDRLLALAK